jgi:hypothetical protein
MMRCGFAHSGELKKLFEQPYLPLGPLVAGFVFLPEQARKGSPGQVPGFLLVPLNPCDWRTSHLICGTQARHESRNPGGRHGPGPELPWRQAERPEGPHQVAYASLLGPFLARVGVHVALLGPVVRLRAVGVCGVVWGHVGAVFGDVPAHRVAAATAVAVSLGHDG